MGAQVNSRAPSFPLAPAAPPRPLRVGLRPMAYDNITYEVAPTGVATIALDQPETRNALSDDVLAELLTALQAPRDDDAVHCVVLTSTHDSVFSSGGNPRGFAA